MMRHSTTAALLALALTAIACSGTRDDPRYKPAVGDFTIVLIPDTQYYMGEFMPLLEAQIQWIADHRVDENIVFAIHLGDMTNGNTPGEWAAMDRVMQRLDGAEVPWSAMPGNHDGIKGGVINSGGYNRFFGVKRFAGKPWYGGHFGVTNDSNYSLFSAGGMDFMVLSLAFGTPQEQLDWANSVFAQHPNRKVIFATHAYLDADGSYLERGETYAVSDKPHRWNDGKEIWNKVLRKHGNLMMTVCGHVPDQGRRVSRGDAGNVVQEILANYQGNKRGGNGYLRLLRFSPTRNRLWVEAYSPPLDKYWLNPKHTFAVDLLLR